jgi:spore germination protein PC
MDPFQAQQLFHHLNWQAQMLIHLDQSIQNLHHEIETLTKSSTPTIGRIDYKFDQLKIEKLEGILNIGISPQTGKSIEDFSVNGQPLAGRSIESSNEDTSYYTSIQKKINDYLDTDLPIELQRLSTEYRLTLDYEKHTFIIEDLRKQIDERILHYCSEAVITEKVKNDILNGLKSYLSKLSESESEAR